MQFARKTRLNSRIYGRFELIEFRTRSLRLGDAAIRGKPIDIVSDNTWVQESILVAVALKGSTASFLERIILGVGQANCRV